MASKRVLSFNQEERLAFVVLMFFSLGWLSPTIWDNFDKTKEATAQNVSAEMTYAEVKPKPSGSYIIEDFFKRIDYYDFKGASELIHAEIKPESIIKPFEGLYHITATNITLNNQTDDLKSYFAIINIIQKENAENPLPLGSDTLIITLKKSNTDEWKIYKISPLK